MKKVIRKLNCLLRSRTAKVLCVGAFFLSVGSLSANAAQLDGSWLLPKKLQDASGLAFCQGRLLTISDRTDNLYWWLKPDQSESNLEFETLALNGVAPSWNGLYRLLNSKDHDYEAIACRDNQLLIASERSASLLLFDSDGSLIQQWNLAEQLSQMNLGQTFNAGIEAVTFWQHGIMLGMEREPAALVFLDPQDPELRLIRLNIQGEPFKDISGLAVNDGWLWVLERQRMQVRKMRIDLEHKRAVSSGRIDLSKTLELPQFRYKSQKYEIAEGLEIQQRNLFLILDNGRKRAVDGGHNQGWLLRFKLTP